MLGRYNLRRYSTDAIISVALYLLELYFLELYLLARFSRRYNFQHPLLEAFLGKLEDPKI